MWFNTLFLFLRPWIRIRFQKAPCHQELILTYIFPYIFRCGRRDNPAVVQADAPPGPGPLPRRLQVLHPHWALAAKLISALAETARRIEDERKSTPKLVSAACFFSQRSARSNFLNVGMASFGPQMACCYLAHIGTWVCQLLFFRPIGCFCGATAVFLLA